MNGRILPVHVLYERLMSIRSVVRSVVLTGALIVLPAMAAHGSETPPPNSLPAVTDLMPAPELHFGTLPNGFRYILQQHALPAGRVSMHLNVQVGALHEADDERGLAHFLEHMQFNGSTHFPPGELVKYFQRIGMDFGPDANAHTGFDETGYDILLSKNRPEDIREGLVVLSDYAQGALLLPEEIERERRVVLAEKRSRDSVSYRTFVKTLGFEFPGTRLPQRMPIGEREVIDRADREMIKRFYDAWYRPELMVVVVVGDINISETAAAIADVFGRMTPRAPERAFSGIGSFQHEGVKVFYHYEQEAGETTVRLEVVTPGEMVPDSRQRRARRFTAEVADRIVRDRLNALLDKPETPFTGAAISSGTFLKSVDYAEISAECDPEKWSQTLAAIEQVLRQALDFGFSARELARAKKDIAAELDQAVRQMPTRLSQAIARGVLRDINQDRVPLSPEQTRALYEPILDKLTPEQVLAAFRQTWRPDHRLVFVTGNADLSKNGADAAGALERAYHSATRAPVQRLEEKALQVFPYLPVPTVEGAIAEEDTVADIGITRLTLANGVRVMIKPTDFKADEIQVRVSFGPGRAGVPADLPGLGVFAESLLNESGVGRMTRDELEVALAGKNLSASFAVKEDRFVLDGRTGSEALELLLQLLTTRLLDPAFRPDAAQLVKARYAQEFRADAASFRGAMRIWGYRQLASGDPRFGMPAADVFASRTIAEVKHWLLPFFRNAPLEVVIVGDVDARQAAHLARRYFGSLEARTEAPRSVVGVSFPTGKRYDTPLATRIDNSLLVLALPTADAWDISQTRRLSILAEVISEKLRVVVREALGATYSPFAVNRGSRAYAGYGTLMIFTEVAPGDADRVAAAIRSMLERLVKEGVSDDELRRAVDPVLTGIRDMQKQNSYWTDTVLAGASRHPEQLDWCRSIADDYAAITAAEINSLAGRYLSLPRAATLFFYPDRQS
ncbi:MAG: insulinase family protein [Pseudomonadota bacterium]